MVWGVIPPASLRSLAVRLGQSSSSALPSLVVMSSCAPLAQTARILLPFARSNQ